MSTAPRRAPGPFRLLAATLAAALVALALPGPAGAGVQSGSGQTPTTLDQTFGTGGIAVADFGGDEVLQDFSVLPDGRIVAAGTGGGQVRVARFNPDGTLDTTLDGDGMVSFTPQYPGKVAVLGDGKIIIAGTKNVLVQGSPQGKYNWASVFTLQRYNTDGTLDATLMDGAPTFNMHDINSPYRFGWTYARSQPGGGVALAGFAWRYLEPYQPPSGVFLPEEEFAVGYVTPTGTIIDYQKRGVYLPMGGHCTSVESAEVAAFPLKGTLIAGGFATCPIFNIYRPLIVVNRYHDARFGGRSQVSADSRVELPGGLLVAGDRDERVITYFSGTNTLMRRKVDGTPDPTFGARGDGTINPYFGVAHILPLPDGKLLVAADRWLVRLNDDGSPDASFDDDGGALAPIPVAHMELQPDGKLLIGSGAGINGQRDFKLARYEDADTDGDGRRDTVDNCAATPNPDQLDADSDYLGDACDPDADPDEDAITNSSDNCPQNANSDQLDTDRDSQGDACDADDDGDGRPDTEDAFPLDPQEWADTDGDRVGDNADADDDGDGAPDSQDAFPLDATESVDTDGDGIGNNADADDDGDGVPDAGETTAGSDPLNSASMPEACDGVDNDLNDGIDEGFTNTDGDTQSDCVDADDDNDGVADTSDAFPLDGAERLDTDGDGVGNNADSDDDNDLQSDAHEASCGSDPLDAGSKSPDADGDNTPDCAETSARPASKADCMNGGFRRFTDPAFKNQGQCVSFVESNRGRD